MISNISKAFWLAVTKKRHYKGGVVEIFVGGSKFGRLALGPTNY
jgi:hypothetical protein